MIYVGFRSINPISSFLNGETAASYLCSDLSVEDEVSDEHWWRGCKMRDSIGCSEHKWLHHDHEYLVDECVCDTELCNKDMQPIPSSTTVKSTTPSGKLLFIVKLNSII